MASAMPWTPCLRITSALEREAAGSLLHSISCHYISSLSHAYRLLGFCRDGQRSGQRGRASTCCCSPSRRGSAGTGRPATFLVPLLDGHAVELRNSSPFPDRAPLSHCAALGQPRTAPLATKPGAGRPNSTGDLPLSKKTAARHLLAIVEVQARAAPSIVSTNLEALRGPSLFGGG